MLNTDVHAISSIVKSLTAATKRGAVAVSAAPSAPEADCAMEPKEDAPLAPPRAPHGLVQSLSANVCRYRRTLAVDLQSIYVHLHSSVTINFFLKRLTGSSTNSAPALGSRWWKALKLYAVITIQKHIF